MLETFKRDDDRGQVGIGTLIVFIAMVLVAAIAAGVLINTAGFLQSGAEETGQQSSDQVTNRLDVVSVIGENIDAANSEVDRAVITVKKAPGANNIDLSSTTLQFVHSSGSSDLTYQDQFDSGDTSALTLDGTQFGVVEVQDQGGDSLSTDGVVLNDPADRAQIVIDTSPSGVTDGFGEGDTATVRINTQSGGTTEVRLVVPQTLSGDSAVGL
ncbi:archaellin/type IV pilin N-terminal domain-containing protein [Haloarcula laminariae]|uniref:archaellin/type IV pilin N-terminal domain-containing protein n=1 Tax=Haloarcula laminariae TaxID=2961577 RepID=UPI0021C8BAA0|nr:archaellin/type IV pilin N-terminal domain-containing protein [Halomicroarcula laminariae]